MSVYLIIIEIFLLILVVYESYKYFIFKYNSVVVDAIIKEIKEFEVFQRPSTKAFEGSKIAVKITLEYQVNEKKYTRTEKIKKSVVNAKVGETIKLKLINKDPEQYSLKTDSIRFRRMLLVIIALSTWSILTFMIV